MLPPFSLYCLWLKTILLLIVFTFLLTATNAASIMPSTEGTVRFSTLTRSSGSPLTNILIHRSQAESLLHLRSHFRTIPMLLLSPPTNLVSARNFPTTTGPHPAAIRRHYLQLVGVNLSQLLWIRWSYPNQ